MARRKINKPGIEKWDDWKGRTAEGVLVGIRQGEHQGLLDLRMSDGLIHTFSMTTAMNPLLDAPTGCRVWLTYKGDISSKKGNPFRDIEVEIDDGRTESGGEAAGTPAVAESGTDDDIPF